VPQFYRVVELTPRLKLIIAYRQIQVSCYTLVGNS
jgi:hypothetical protein